MPSWETGNCLNVIFNKCSSLQKYVIEKSLQCVAVIIKRGTLDDLTGYSPLQNLMASVHQLFASNDLHMVRAYRIICINHSIQNTSS